MKNIKPQMIIDSLLKLAVIIALIVAVTTKQHYSFYNFLRWLITASFVWFAISSYNKKQLALMIFYIAIAILFNPFKPFWFQKHTWYFYSERT